MHVQEMKFKGTGLTEPWSLPKKNEQSNKSCLVSAALNDQSILSEPTTNKNLLSWADAFCYFDILKFICKQ